KEARERSLGLGTPSPSLSNTLEARHRGILLQRILPSGVSNSSPYLDTELGLAEDFGNRISRRANASDFAVKNIIRLTGTCRVIDQTVRWQSLLWGTVDSEGYHGGEER
ncbi:hypothetical protein F2P56_021463, partial [Juglans regia]